MITKFLCWNVNPVKRSVILLNHNIINMYMNNFTFWQFWFIGVLLRTKHFINEIIVCRLNKKLEVWISILCTSSPSFWWNSNIQRNTFSTGIFPHSFCGLGSKGKETYYNYWLVWKSCRIIALEVLQVLNLLVKSV